MQRNNKALDTGLVSLTKAPGTLSRWGEGTGCLLESLRSPSRRVSRMGLCAPKNQQRREREKKERKKDTRTQALMEQRCFNDFSVSIQRLWYKKFLSTMIKIRKPNERQLSPREQGITNGHKSGDNPYLKKGYQD